MKLCAISCDLDEVPNYFRIHGLEPPEQASHAVYDVAIDRLAGALAVPMTWFVIGEDVEREASASKLLERAADGDELANHSHRHLYDLTRRTRREKESEVANGAELIERACGVRPRGFRAPGYTVDDELLEVVRDCGHEWDSSVFPCPPYYLLKHLAIAGYRLRGRPSTSVSDTPAVLRAPVRPYRLGEPYWRRARNGAASGALLELPIQVTRGLRLPFIGTTLTLAGPTRARSLTRMVLGEPLVNLELHGIDALDADDGLEALRGVQPDVRVPATRKLDALSAVVDLLRREGYAFVTLSEAAERFR